MIKRNDMILDDEKRTVYFDFTIPDLHTPSGPKVSSLPLTRLGHSASLGETSKEQRGMSMSDMDKPGEHA